MKELLLNRRKSTQPRMNLSPSTILIILFILICIALVTAYFIFKRFFETQIRMKAMDIQPPIDTNEKYLKLQAYERLILFCERTNLPTLLLRIGTKSENAEAMSSALILAIQQEYEHNVTQQLYVSTKLWDIVKLAKNQMIEIISQAKEGLGAGASAQSLYNELMHYYGKQQRVPIETAREAIKKEAGLLF